MDERDALTRSRSELTFSRAALGTGAAGVVLVLALAACAGPKVPLKVGLKEVPSDIEFEAGRRAAPTVAPIPPVGLPLSPRIIRQFELPFEFPAILIPRVACPTADPLRAPAREAVNTVAAPPASGIYAFRNEGVFEVTGLNAKAGRFPSSSARRVINVAKITITGTSEIWYRFDVEATLGDLTTTTTYTLVPEGDVPQVKPGSSAGLFITRVRTEFVDGTEEDFRPATAPGLLLLPFPVVVGDSWEAAGTDPRSGVTLVFTGRVGQKTRVDACGTPLDAWTVRIAGTVGEGAPGGGAISPAGYTSIVADYAFGTQYGALSLMDTVQIDRIEPVGTLHQRNHTTINIEPGFPDPQVPECGGECLEQ